MGRKTIKNPIERGRQGRNYGASIALVDKNYILQKDAHFSNGPRVKKNRSVAMMQGMSRVWNYWIQFCKIMYDDAVDAHQAFQNAKLEDFRRYFQYRLSTGNFVKQSGVWTEWKNMLCLFQDETGQQVDLQIRLEMHGLLNRQFVDEYDLDLSAREKPVMSVEDLLVALHHLWTFDRSTFPIERQRVQLALLLLVIAYTSSRPGALVEASCAAGTNECLTYNDVRLLIIPNPEEPIRNIVVMEVTLLFTKGNRQTKKPTTYLFHEREDNLALCPILHILALALADEAFEAENMRTPEDIYGLQVPAGRNSLHLKWKAGIRDVPIFRRSVRTKDGISISPDRALIYDTLTKYLKGLGSAAGFRRPLTPYCLRRGVANAVNGVATDAERNQVLGHTRSEIFLRHYIQQHVRADVQSAYLGMPARQALFNAVGRMSLDRDPRVPQSLSDEQKAEVKRNPQLVALVRERSTLRKELIRAYGLLKNAIGTSNYAKYLQLGRKYDSMEKTMLDNRLTEIKTVFFEAIDTREIEVQLQSGLDRPFSTDGELLAMKMPLHSFEERSRLAVELFGALKVEDPDGSQCRTRRCSAIRDMAALTFKRETPRQEAPYLQSRASAALTSELNKLDVFHHDDEPDLFPITCPSTVCLFCLGNENITTPSRTYSFARKDSLTRHVHNSHLRYIHPWAELECPHPTCDFVYYGHQGFKNHAENTHNILHDAKKCPTDFPEI